MPILHVSYDFIRLSDHDVDAFTRRHPAQTLRQRRLPRPARRQNRPGRWFESLRRRPRAMTDAGPSATAAKDAALTALVN